MLSKTAEKETSAAEQPDDEVKFSSKKRKANSAPGKKEKVRIYMQNNCLMSTLSSCRWTILSHQHAEKLLANVS